MRYIGTLSTGVPASSVGPSQLSATGTASSTTYLRGDNTWATPAGGGGGVTPLTITAKKTANYTAAANEFVPADSTSGVITVTFPAAPADGTRVGVKKVDSSTNAVNLTLGGSDVFNIASGSTTGSLALQHQGLVAQYKASGAIWYVESTDAPLSGLDSRYVQPAQTVALTNKDLTDATNTFPTLNQSTTGNAATATVLATARNIDGQAFDGSAAITVIAPGSHATTSKATPVDADELPLVDSAASFGLKKLTWANLKAAVKTYYDSVTSTLTNKSVDLAGNTLTGTTAQFNTALSDNDFATLAGSETLSSKTLTTPTIASFTNATHNHAAAAGGGQLTATTALNATGTASSTTYLRGDNTWATPAAGGSGSTTPTASTIAEWDANVNMSANNFIEGFTTTATAAGTTTLTVSSTGIQVFTGSTTQTVQLPTTSVVAGAQFLVVNQSSGAVTVQSSGANTVVVVAAGTAALLTAVVATPTTAANWDARYWAATVTSGKSLSVSNTLTLAGTDGTTMTFPSTSATIARTDAANTFTGVQTMTSPSFTTPVLGTPTSGTLTNCTFPTLNQNTSGSAATLTTPRAINGVSFNGSAAITITPRVNTTTSSATPSINTDTTDLFTITALAAAITSMTTNLTGTPVNGQKLMIRIKDNATARAITWGTSFASSGVATLLATTVISKTHLVGLVYDSAASLWVCVAVDAAGY